MITPPTKSRRELLESILDESLSRLDERELIDIVGLALIKLKLTGQIPPHDLEYLIDELATARREATAELN